MPDDLRETMAAALHEVWARQMTALCGLCWQFPTGGVVIPAELFAAIQRQVRTPYEALPESEREGDRQAAEVVIRVFDRG